MKKIVINKSYGGFELSNEVFERYLELKGISYNKAQEYCGVYYYNKDNDFLSYHSIKRDDPVLVQVVHEFKEKSCDCSNLAIVEIPDDIDYYIDNYDGIESIHETHRIWN